MKAHKSALRSKLDQDSLQMLMRITDTIDSDMDMKSYDPVPAVDHWMSCGERKRHIVNSAQDFHII